jgi:hypothetical protein
MEKTTFPENGFYVHYKHKFDGDDHFNYVYEVVGIGRNTEDKTYTVLYRPMYTNDWMPPATLQSRPLEMFLENVTVEGKTMKRFTPIDVNDEKLISELKERRKEMYHDSI